MIEEIDEDGDDPTETKLLGWGIKVFLVGGVDNRCVWQFPPPHLRRNGTSSPVGRGDGRIAVGLSSLDEHVWVASSAAEAEEQLRLLGTSECKLRWATNTLWAPERIQKNGVPCPVIRQHGKVSWLHD